MKDKFTRAARQYVVALIASGGVFAEGMSFSWSSPIESQIVEGKDCTEKFCVTKDEFAWIATCLSIGAVSSVYFAGLLMSNYGRKLAMMLYMSITISGYAFLTFASTSWMLFLGRILAGIGSGGSAAVIPLYVGEIAQTKIRGVALSVIEMNMQIGILATYLLGYFFSMFLQNIISLGILIFYGMSLLFVPESPYYYVSKNRTSEAEGSLKRLRGKNFNSEDEIKEILEFYNYKKSKGIISLLKDKASRRAFLIVIGLITADNLCGVNVIWFYMAEIFKNAKITIEPNLAAVYVGAISFIATVVSSFLIEKLGRRLLLLLSFAVTFGCCIILGEHLQSGYHDSNQGLSVIPIVVMSVYIFTNSLGIAPMMFVIVGEIFAQDTKDVASSISVIWNHGVSVIVTLLFPILSRSFNFGIIFFIFAIFVFFSFFFVLLLVPETKGKTFPEIQKLLLEKNIRL